jgi:hypothetical protein
MIALVLFACTLFVETEPSLAGDQAAASILDTGEVADDDEGWASTLDTGE